MPKTTNERIRARFDKVSNWVDEVDGDISAPERRDVISGTDGGIFLVSRALSDPSTPFLDEAKMAKLKERLAKAGVRNSLPTADPRLLPLEEQGQDLNRFLEELHALREILPAVKADALAEMRSLRGERRELSGIRKSFRNLLRDRSAGVKAAFERMAKGGPAPSWVYSK